MPDESSSVTDLVDAAQGASQEGPTGEATTTRWRRWLRPLVMPAVYTLLTLAVFWRLWTPIHGAERSWKYDPPHAYWGDMVLQVNTLAEGELPLWDPHDRGGFPVYGDPQPGFYYPPNWPLWLWGLITSSVPFAVISFKIVLHWIFGSIGMHYFLRRFAAREPACYAAGILFAFTSPKLRYMGSALNWSVAWIPWVLLAIDYYAEKPSPRRGILMGSSLAMVLLCGAPAVVLYTLILALPFGLYRMRGRIIANAKSIGVAAGVCLLWILPLMASNAEQLPESIREVRSYAFITDSVFTPAHVLTFLVPRLGQGENPYVGVLVLIAIALAIVSRKHRALAWIFLGVALFSILVSLGGHSGFLPALSSAVSPFSLFRRAHRYLYITSAAFSILVGLGLAYLYSLEERDQRAQLAKRLSWIGGALCFALGTAYLVAIVVTDKIATPKNSGFALAFLSAATFTLLVRFYLTHDGKARHYLAWSLPLLLFLDVWTANFHASDVGMTHLPKTPNDEKIAELKGIDKAWRVYDDDFLQYRPGTRLGLRDFSGYEEDPLALSRYTRFLKQAKRNQRLFGHANVRYFLDGPGKLRFSPNLGTKVAPNIWELKERAPAIYYVPAPTLAKSADESLKLLPQISPGQGAVVEAAANQIPKGPDRAPVAVGTIQSLDTNGLRATIETPGPGLIVIAEAFYPGWQARLDGKEVPIYPANHMFRGIPVASAGKHTVQMRFAPRRFYYLLPSFFAAMGLLLWAAFWRRERL